MREMNAGEAVGGGMASRARLGARASPELSMHVGGISAHGWAQQ